MGVHLLTYIYIYIFIFIIHYILQMTIFSAMYNINIQDMRLTVKAVHNTITGTCVSFPISIQNPLEMRGKTQHCIVQLAFIHNIFIHNELYVFPAGSEHQTFR